MQPIDFLVIHSTDTPEGQDITAQQIGIQHTTSTEDGGLGFNRSGFDYLILRDGTLEVLTNETTPTRVDLWGLSGGRQGISGNLKHLAYVGGRTLKGKFWKDTRTDAQSRAMEVLIQFYVLRFPNIRILGRDDTYRTMESQNPAFDVFKWLELNGIPIRNRYRRSPIVIR